MKPREFWVRPPSSVSFCGACEEEPTLGGIHVREVLPNTVTISRDDLFAVFEKSNLHVPYNPEMWRMSIDDLERELFGPVARSGSGPETLEEIGREIIRIAKEMTKPRTFKIPKWAAYRTKPRDR